MDAPAADSSPSTLAVGEHSPQPFGSMFDAFLSNTEESTVAFVSQFLMLSTEEQAKLVLSFEGSGGVSEEKATEEMRRQREEEILRELADTNNTEGEAAGAASSPQQEECEYEDISDLEACVPETRTGYMTTLFDEGSTMHEVLYDTLQLDVEERIARVSFDDYEKNSAKEKVNTAIATASINEFAAPALDDFLSLPEDSAPTTLPEDNTREVPPQRHYDPESDHEVGAPPELELVSGGEDSSSSECNLPGLDDNDTMTEAEMKNAMNGAPHMTEGHSTPEEGSAVVVPPSFRQQLQEVIRDVDDDVVPFVPEDDDDDVAGVEVGKYYKEFKGDWKAFRLSPVVMVNEQKNTHLTL